MTPAAPSDALTGLLPRARPAASATLWGEAWRAFRRHPPGVGRTAVVLRTLIGALAGYVGGVVDHALMRATDLFLSLPQLPLLLLIVYLFRDGLKGLFGLEAGIFVLVVTVIGGLRWMPVARVRPV